MNASLQGKALNSMNSESGGQPVELRKDEMPVPMRGGKRKKGGRKSKRGRRK